MLLPTEISLSGHTKSPLQGIVFVTLLEDNRMFNGHGGAIVVIVVVNALKLEGKPWETERTTSHLGESKRDQAT